MNLLEDGNGLFLVLFLPVSVLSSHAQLWNIPGSGWSICPALPCPESYLPSLGWANRAWIHPGPVCCSFAHVGRETGGEHRTGRSLGRDLGKARVADAGKR